MRIEENIKTLSRQHCTLCCNISTARFLLFSLISVHPNSHCKLKARKGLADCAWSVSWTTTLKRIHHNLSSCCKLRSLHSDVHLTTVSGQDYAGQRATDAPCSILFVQQILRGKHKRWMADAATVGHGGGWIISRVTAMCGMPSSSSSPTSCCSGSPSQLSSSTSVSPASKATTARLHLEPSLGAWLKEMATAHNCGSVNKTLRDLLDFYACLPSSDLANCMASASASVAESPGIASHSANDELAAHITRHHMSWLEHLSCECNAHIDVILARLIAFAMNELDDEEIFENSPHLARNTTDLYSDCNIFSNICWNSIFECSIILATGPMPGLTFNVRIERCHFPFNDCRYTLTLFNFGLHCLRHGAM